MAKRVGSMLIQGAGTGAMIMMPGGGYQRMGVAAASQAFDNLVTGRNKPQTVSLSNTEKIQLAQLLEELNGALLSDYHSYKNTLMLLSDMQQTVINKNNDYSRAIKSGNEVAVMASATAYYKAAKNQIELRQKAKLHRMKLERLAGMDAVGGLQLALFAPESDQTATPEPVGEGNLVKLEPAPDNQDEAIAAPAILSEKQNANQPNGKQLSDQQNEQLRKLQSLAAPEPQNEPVQQYELNEIGPTLEDLDESMNKDNITADDFRKAADARSTLESGHRIGIGEGEAASPLPGTDEAMPVLRRAP